MGSVVVFLMLAEKVRELLKVKWRGWEMGTNRVGNLRVLVLGGLGDVVSKTAVLGEGA